ncbi:MAG: N-acetyltransferase [Chthoniobacterales bacterium]
MTIREENKADFPEIAALTQAAFGGDYEATLIEKLRAAHLVIVSLVAVEQGSVIGHIPFSELEVEVDGRRVTAAALAPMAVRPDRQRRGIGSKLVETGLDGLRDRSYEAVIVLGHPDYYPRFGFTPSLTASLVAPFSGRAFMGLELMSGSLSGSRGSVEYPEAFGL